MSYTFVEDYASYLQAPDTLDVFPGPDHRSVPSPSLVEDENGNRLLVVSVKRGAAIGARVWTQAHAGGASAIVLNTGKKYAAILTEDFLEHRTEDRQAMTYGVPNVGILMFDHPPSRREIMRALRERSVPLHEHEPLPGSQFVHLHAHSEYSALDGLSRVQEMVDAAVRHEQPAMAVTDHGGCWGHPDLQSVCAKAGVKPIFGIEANFVDDRRFRPMSKPTKAKTADQTEYERSIAAWEEEQKRGRDYWHLVLLALTDEGLRNIWAMSSEAEYDGLYYRPRMDWETLEKYSAGVMATTSCLRGPLSAALLNEDDQLATMRLARLNGIFDGRVAIELHTNQLPEQKVLNERLVELGRTNGNGLIVVTDSHYPTKEHAECHKVWIAAQMQKELTEDADIFAGDQDYHLMHLDEVEHSLSYLPDDVVAEATRNTVDIAQQCNAAIQTPKSSVPIFSKKGTIEERMLRDKERLVDLCLSNWHKTQGKVDAKGDPIPESVYFARFEREMAMIVDKGFCGYFLMCAEYCTWTREQGKLIGPGRGSGGGCLVAYLCNIVEIDAVEADLIFERFMTKGRTALPDFDVDFPSSWREELTNHVIERYGTEHVVRVGTHVRKKNSGIIRTLGEQVLASTYDIQRSDVSAISAIIKEAEANSAGLGESWENVLNLAGDQLDPYIAKYPKLFEMADLLVGRLSTYGKHPAGVVIDPDNSLIGRLPMAYAHTQLPPCKAGDHSACHAVASWNMDVLESVLHLVKFDFLTLRTLDTLQLTVDLIKERTGVAPDFYSWKEEYHDSVVWEEISKGRTLGAFQVETWEGVKMCKRYKPTSLAGLADVITLVRPGPMRSGLTDMYIRRRRGEEDVDYPHPLLEQTLAKTYGAILYQEDVMNVCMVLAGYDENEADKVRKMLGKKQVSEAAEAGRKFVNACVERGIDREPMEALWAQIEEFAKYSFNRAHAFAYAVLGYWCMWLKVHYPAEFLTAILSTVKGERIPEFVNDARRRGFKVLPPDINTSNVGFTIVDEHTIRYGLASIGGIGEGAANAVIASRPYVSYDDFIERRSTKCDMGDITKLAAIGAFDSLEPNRKQLEERLTYTAAKDSTNTCVHRDESWLSQWDGLPCRFDWGTVEVQLTSKGEPKKGWRPNPKKCSKACKQYTPRELEISADCYTDVEIREREKELLGLYLSSTPFDDLPEDHIEVAATGTDIEEGPLGEDFFTAVLINSIRAKEDRNGNPMAFLSMVTHDGATVSAVCFKQVWRRVRANVEAGTLCYVVLYKTDRGLQVTGLEPLTKKKVSSGK
jgi:DNA polymerase-3 subunit alpha